MDPITADWLTQSEGLATRLRLLRIKADLSGKALADITGWQPSKISRLENGRQIPKAEDVKKWAEACGADERVTQELVELLGEVHARPFDWRRRTRRGLTVIQNHYRELTEKSLLIRSFQIVYMPGVLQVSEYAEAVLREFHSLVEVEDDDIADAVVERMQRQQLLYDSTRRFEFLITEPVLRFLICPPTVMHAQLDRLQTVIDMPNVRFGIIPLGTRLATTPQNSFQIYDDLVIVDSFVGETLYEGDQATAYSAVMDRLWKDGVEGSDARQLIISASNDLRQRYKD